MTRKAAINGTGKLKANKPIGDGPDCREHGTRWKTGARGVLTPALVREYASLGMSLTAIAYLLGCTKQNVQAAMKDDALNQALCEGAAELQYKASSCIARRIDNDEWVPAIFVLKCKPIPGEKGWIEEQYRKEEPNADNPKVRVFVPWNGRDPLPEDAISFSDNDGSLD